MYIKCEACGGLKNHRHMHDAAHGLSGTHMAGTERFECEECGHAIYKEEGKRLGIGDAFRLD